MFPNADGTTPFRMPFQYLASSDDMLLAWDYTHDYANPVDPAGWPKASVGRDVPTVRFVAGFARQSNWWPWMKMGGSQYQDGILVGRVFSHKGLPGTGDVPPKVLAYLERHAPST